MQKLILRQIVHFRSEQLCSRGYWLLSGSSLSWWVSPSVTGSPTSTRRPTCWSPVDCHPLAATPSHRRRRRVGHAETPLRWVAVRLSFDLLPKDWSGFALITVPGYGWTAPWFSGAWIAISTVFCAYLAIRLVKNWFDGCLLIMSLVCAFGYISIGEGAFWRPVVVLTVATAVALIRTIHHAKSSTREAALHAA